MPPINGQESLADQIRNYGKPAPGQIVTLDEIEMSSTRFLNNAASVPNTLTFYQNMTLDGYWNTHNLPLTEQAVDITAVKLNTNLELAGASPLGIKADNVFWSQAWLTIQYRQRGSRIRLNGNTIINRVITYASGATPAGVFKPSSQRQDGWTYLQEPLKCGPQQTLVVTLTLPTGYTSLSYTAGTSAIIYNQGLTNDSGAAFQLLFKATVKGESLQ